MLITFPRSPSFKQNCHCLPRLDLRHYSVLEPNSHWVPVLTADCRRKRCGLPLALGSDSYLQLFGNLQGHCQTELWKLCKMHLHIPGLQLRYLILFHKVWSRVWSLVMLSSPSSLCSLHDRPMNLKDKMLRQRKQIYSESSWPRRWQPRAILLGSGCQFLL